MAAARLIDSQKQELVRRFRQGESTQALADHFGCSTTTITRMVRAEVGPEVYAALKDQRQRGGRDRQISLAIEEEALGDSAELADQPPASLADGERAEPERAVEPPATTSERSEMSPRETPPQRETAPTSAAPPSAPTSRGEGDEPLESPDDEATVLAIDDADDFADGEEAEDDLLPTDEEGEEEDFVIERDDFHPVAVLPIAVDDQRETLPAPWCPEALPACAYLLVDKTVELQAQPLGEIPELGRLPSEEQERQALVLFTNPRQAKRHCGRSQRVIKLPDPALLGRTAPYLLAQGISRVVIEGTLYALPDPQ